MKLFQRKFYGILNFEEFMTLQKAMFDIGFDLSAHPPDYGKATCLNCRGIVNVSYEAVTPKYAMQHRKVCGDVHLSAWVRNHLAANLMDES